MKKKIIHYFRNNRVTVDFVKPPKKTGAIGIYYVSVDNKKSMKICPPDRLAELEFLNVCIHESLHACYPDLEESVIFNTSNNIAGFLYRIGFRLNEKQFLKPVRWKEICKVIRQKRKEEEKRSIKK